MCYIISQGMRKSRMDKELPGFIKSGRKTTGTDSSEIFVASGFDHPQLQIIGNNRQTEAMYWGLIPVHTRTRQEAKEMWEKRLIARGETMFELVSYRHAAETSRCIIPATGYFEHHHKSGKRYPYYIHRNDRQLFFVGAICSTWTAPETGKTVKTFAIVTTPANELAAQIHNNPKISEPRMPLILDETDLELWLDGTPEQVRTLVKPNTSIRFAAHPVAPVTGKDSPGNCAKAIEQKFYAGLNALLSPRGNEPIC